MKRYKNLFLILIAISILLLVFSGSYAQEKVWTLKLTTSSMENSAEGKGYKKFMEIAEEKSGGRLTFDAYFGGILGDKKVQVENTITGLQDIYAETFSFFQNYVPEFSVLSLSYFFRNNEDLKKFLLSPIQEEMEKKLLEKTGICILNKGRNWVKGPYRIIISRKPVKSLEDVKGLKVRQADAPTNIKIWTTFGANISILPWSDVYLALQQGMIDAVPCGIAEMGASKLYELAKYATVTNEMPLQVALNMNNKRFKSLPEDLQNVLIDAANEAGDYFSELINKEGARVREETSTKYGVTYYEIDLEPWMKKAAGVREELMKSGLVSRDLVHRIEEYLGY